jgi:hypothetical protein
LKLDYLVFLVRSTHLRNIMSADSKNVSSSKKKGGGFLQRKVNAKETITEEELLRKNTITPDDVLKLGKITRGE